MLKATHTILRKIWLASLLACLIAPALSFAGTPFAFASTTPPRALPTNPCLREFASMSHNGNNDVAFTAATTSYCGTSGTFTSVNQQALFTNGCEGTLGTGPSNLPASQNVELGQSLVSAYTDEVGCVICIYKNHVLTGREYPNFTVFLTVSPTGSYKQGGRTINATDDSPATDSLAITNTGAYAPACPATH